MDKKIIVLAAGGTGGHIFPAYALAEHLLNEGHRLYLITDKRGAEFKNRPENLRVLTLPLCRSKGGIVGKTLLIFSIILSFFYALFHLIKINPKVILGFGGFPSAPTMSAAILLKPFTQYNLILHEQNAVLGRVNKIFLSNVNVLATSFPKTWGIREKFQKKIAITGNLVRPAFEKIGKEPYSPPSKDGLIHLLVVGGSQGAKSFSTFIPEALSHLPLSLKERIHVVQQSRPELLSETRQRYEVLHITATVESFFPNIDTLIEKSHIVICRAGASTLFEIAHAKRPAIYIPFPHAMDNHQYFNAKVVEDLGGGWVLLENQDTQTTLENLLESILIDPKKLASAARNVHDLLGENTLKKFSHLIQSL